MRTILSICAVFFVLASIGCDEKRDPQRLYETIESMEAFGPGEEVRITLRGDVEQSEVAALRKALEAEVAPGRRIASFERDEAGFTGLLEHGGDPWILAAHIRALRAFSGERPDVAVELRELPDGPAVRLEGGRIVENAAETRQFLNLMDRERWDYTGAFESVQFCGDFSGEAGAAFQDFVREELARRFEQSDLSTTTDGGRTCFAVSTDGRVTAASSAIRSVSMAWMRTLIEHERAPMSGRGRVVFSGDQEIRQAIHSDHDLLMLEWELMVSRRQTPDTGSTE